MAYLGSTGLQVSSISPLKYAADVATDARILITFASDLVGATPENLAAAVKVRETETGVDVPGTLSYLAKVVTFVPNTVLRTNTNYTVTLLAGKLVDVVGSKLALNYVSSFTTNVATAISKPSLLSPSDLSVEGSAPTLTWSAVAPTYRLQVSRDKSFTNLAVDSNGATETSFTPALDMDAQYYWRVKGINGTIEGDWSNVWTFYYGVAQGVEPAPGFQVVSVDPNPGESMVALTNRTIRVEFSQEPTEEVSVVVKYSPIDGDPTVSGGTAVAVTSISQNVLTITLSELLGNMKYHITVSSVELPEEVEWYFGSWLSPHYSTVELIRLDIGPFIARFTDYDIDFTIMEVSKQAEEIADSSFSADSAAYYRCYVRYQTENRLLGRAMMEMATKQGENIRLGDFSVELDTSLVPDINQATKFVRDRLAECERYLRGDKGVARPVYATKSESGYPYPLAKRRSF